MVSGGHPGHVPAVAGDLATLGAQPKKRAEGDHGGQTNDAEKQRGAGFRGRARQSVGWGGFGCLVHVLASSATHQRDATDIGLHLTGLLVAVRRITLHGAADDAVPLRGALGAQGGGFPNTTRELAGDHLVNHDAEGVNVRAVVDLRAGVKLLGRGVVGRAHAGAGLGAEAAVGVVALGQTKVAHLHPAIPREHDVTGLDVPMHDAVLMGELQRITDLWQQGERHLLRHGAGADHVHHVRSIHQLHDDVQVVRPGFTEVDDADDVWVVQLRHGQRLTAETLLEVVVLTAVPAHDLDGHMALKPNLRALVHRAHAALTQEALDAVVPMRQ